MPILTLKEQGHIIKSKFDKINKLDKEVKIHSLDPSHESMPKYNMKYKNEPNHAAIRHLLGGGPKQGVGVAANSIDVRSSNVHW